MQQIIWGQRIEDNLFIAFSVSTIVLATASGFLMVWCKHINPLRLWLAFAMFISGVALSRAVYRLANDLPGTWGGAMVWAASTLVDLVLIYKLIRCAFSQPPSTEVYTPTNAPWQEDPVISAVRNDLREIKGMLRQEAKEQGVAVPGLEDEDGTSQQLAEWADCFPDPVESCGVVRGSRGGVGRHLEVEGGDRPGQ